MRQGSWVKEVGQRHNRSKFIFAIHFILLCMHVMRISCRERIASHSRMIRIISPMLTCVYYYKKSHFSSTHLSFILSENVYEHRTASPLHLQLNQRVWYRFCELIFFQKRLPIEWNSCLWRSLDCQIRDWTTVRIVKILYYHTRN